jgi:hypothetical protein
LPPPQPAGDGAEPALLPQQFDAKVENTFLTVPLPHLAHASALLSPVFPAL